MLYLLIYLITLCSFTNFSNCNQLENTFGSQIIQEIQGAKKGELLEIIPDKTKMFVLGKSVKPVDITQLKKNLLNENLYEFEITKRCVFIPDYAICLDGDLIIMISLNCDQIRLLKGEEIKTIDIDPGKGEWMRYIEHIKV